MFLARQHVMPLRYAEFRPFMRISVQPAAHSAEKIWELGPARAQRHTCSRWDEDSVSEGDTRAIVRELYDAYGRRDFERVAALIHDDIDWVIYAPMSVFPFADRGTDAPRFWRRWPTLPRPLRSKLITRTS
jgi:hypothetical protein